MALNENDLNELMKANILAIPQGVDSTGVAAQTYFHLYHLALSKAICDHIRQAAEVQTDSGAPDGEHHGFIF
jgi:hypothetical protein